MATSFVLDSPFFDGLNAILSTPEALCTWCHVGHHVDFSICSKSLVSHAPRVLCTMNLDRVWFLDQALNFFVTGQGFSSSSVKWPKGCKTLKVGERELTYVQAPLSILQHKNLTPINLLMVLSNGHI